MAKVATRFRGVGRANDADNVGNVNNANNVYGVGAPYTSRKRKSYLSLA